MKDNLSIVISMIVFVILIVIFPLYNYFERQDDMSYNLALKTTTNFVDEVTESGYLDQDTYDRFIEELSDTGNIYDVQLEAHKKIKTTNDGGLTYDEQYLIEYNNEIFDTTSGGVKNNINEKTIRKGAYILNEGDQFYVKLKNSNTTMAGAIFNTIVPTSKKDRITVNYGGIIKNEAWAKVEATYKDLATAVVTAPTVTLLRSEDTSGHNKKEINQTDLSSITLYPKSECYVFSAEGPNSNSWWNEINNWVWKVKDSSGAEVKSGNTSNTSKEFKFDISSLVDGSSYTLSVYGSDSVGNLTDPTNITIEIKQEIAGGSRRRWIYRKDTFN